MHGHAPGTHVRGQARVECRGGSVALDAAAALAVADLGAWRRSCTARQGSQCRSSRRDARQFDVSRPRGVDDEHGGGEQAALEAQIQGADDEGVVAIPAGLPPRRGRVALLARAAAML